MDHTKGDTKMTYLNLQDHSKIWSLLNKNHPNFVYHQNNTQQPNSCYQVRLLTNRAINYTLVRYLHSRLEKKYQIKKHFWLHLNEIVLSSTAQVHSRLEKHG